MAVTYGTHTLARPTIMYHGKINYVTYNVIINTSMGRYKHATFLKFTKLHYLGVINKLVLILLRENFLPPSASTKSISLSNTRSHIPNLIHNSAFHTPEGTHLDPIKLLVHAGLLFCIIPHLAFNITFSLLSLVC